MTTGSFSATEWKQLVGAPQLIRHLMTVADRGGILTRRGETKALREFLSQYQGQSALIQSIIAGQKDVDEKVDAKEEEVLKMLEQVGVLLEAKTGDDEGDAVRDFFMSAAEAVAKATREQGLIAGGGASPAEEKAMAALATALKATIEDKRRRHTATMGAEASRRVEEHQAKAKAEAEAAAQKKAEEEKAKAEADAAAQKQAAEQARLEREAQEQAEKARQQHAAQAKQISEQMARKREEEAGKADAQTALSQAAQLKEKAEAMKREAEALEREAQTIQSAGQAAGEAAQVVQSAGQQPEAAQVVQSAGQAAAGPAQVVQPTEAAVEIYVVKKGDTLSGIAKALYGKAGRWPEIYEANKDRIENPNLIRPGWKLRIPR